MKRTFENLLALAGLAFIGLGSLLTATPAHAVTPIQSVTQGGVTCSQYSTGYGSWPLTVWDCVNPPGSITALEQGIGAAARNLPTAVKTTLNPVQLYVFTNKTAFTSFTGTAVPAGPGYFGWSSPNKAAVFKNATVNGTNTLLSSKYSVNMLQSLGRSYDSLTGNPSQSVSTTSVFKTAFQYDQSYMNEFSSATVWGAAIAAQYPGQTPFDILGIIYGNSKADIYAFQFQGATGQATLTALQTATTTYLPNTRGNGKNYVLGPLVNQAVANAGVLCVEYATNYGTTKYPQKVWDCVHPYNPTAVELSFASQVRNLPPKFQNALKTDGVKVYTMKNSLAFNNFFGQAAPLAGVLGNSVQSLKVAAAFSEWDDGTQIQDITAFYEAVIVHELGHHLDRLWGNPSQSNAAWLNAISADIPLFNAQPCNVVLTQATCDAYPGSWSNSQKFNAKYKATSAELWAHILQHNSLTSTVPELQNALNYFTNMNNYMGTVYTAGQP